MRMVHETRPHKEIITVAAPQRGHAQSALKLGLEKRTIKIDRLRRCLFPYEVMDGTGVVVARCPDKYRLSAKIDNSPLGNRTTEPVRSLDRC